MAALLPLPARALDHTQLAVIINTWDPLSVQIGEYYIAQRRILFQNVIKLGFPPGKTTLTDKEFGALNVGQLAEYAVEGKVTPQTLEAKGRVRPDAKVKILGSGDVGAAFEVHAHAASAAARQKIESAGGSIVLIGV